MSEHCFTEPFVSLPIIPDREFKITQYGAVGDGITKNTEAFQQAIAACHSSGGGTIIVPAEVWLTGPVHLKSNIRLLVEKEAILHFSDKFADYLPVVFTRWEGTECFNYSPLIYANGCENIVISGEGTLEGNGAAWWHWKKLQHSAAEILYNAEFNHIPVSDRVFGTEQAALRPSFIQPINCKNILIEGITVQDGPQWTIHPVYCENLTIRQVKILTHGPNTDGINPDSCQKVLIEDCYFETGDDCIAINSGMNEDGWRVNKPSQDIWVRNCRMKDGHGGVVIGSGMSGSVRNVLVQNCQFIGGERGIRLKSMRGRGGMVENIRFENIAIHDVEKVAVQINMYYQSATILPQTDTPPTFRNITIKNIHGNNKGIGIEIYGLPENPLQNITLEDINLTAAQSLICHDCHQVTLQQVNMDSTGETGADLVNVSNLEMKDCHFRKNSGI